MAPTFSELPCTFSRQWHAQRRALSQQDLDALRVRDLQDAESNGRISCPAPPIGPKTMSFMVRPPSFRSRSHSPWRIALIATTHVFQGRYAGPGAVAND